MTTTPVSAAEKAPVGCPSGLSAVVGIQTRSASATSSPLKARRERIEPPRDERRAAQVEQRPVAEWHVDGIVQDIAYARESRASRRRDRASPRRWRGRGSDGRPAGTRGTRVPFHRRSRRARLPRHRPPTRCRHARERRVVRRREENLIVATPRPRHAEARLRDGGGRTARRIDLHELAAGHERDKATVRRPERRRGTFRAGKWLRRESCRAAVPRASHVHWRQDRQTPGGGHPATPRTTAHRCWLPACRAPSIEARYTRLSTGTWRPENWTAKTTIAASRRRAAATHGNGTRARRGASRTPSEAWAVAR